MCMDSDDLLENGAETSRSTSYPDEAVKLLRNEDVAFVHTLLRMFGAFDGLTISSYPVSESMVLRKHHIPICICYRKSDFKHGASYDESIKKWQDWSFGISLLATRWQYGKKNQIGFISSVNYLYRVHERWNRLSAATVSEFDMVLTTVRRHLDYFQDKLRSAGSAEEIAKFVASQKPSRLIDLLYVASFDRDLAISIVEQRRAELASPFSGLGIP